MVTEKFDKKSQNVMTIIVDLSMSSNHLSLNFTKCRSKPLTFTAETVKINFKRAIERFVRK